jgi:hypothetical protein
MVILFYNFKTDQRMTMNLTAQIILEDLHAAEDECQDFEKKYGVLSEYFYAAYTNGSLDDNGNPDFALWAGAYEVLKHRQLAYRNLVVAETSVIDEKSFQTE